ncbi:DegT/DnrJ/EryC1/StrS family aminotransferase [Fibrivirga algicola]|uniref:DegT/DnrJ/EryC1/StrS family aminotransferase n=1 Tax=Fibrivirga algicola TaxID=2950420 RepID=A0ABX0QQ19_9BACT|nr:DegT/DnrJ/EryC1/StrS family aminotransferase [Fibrivirga algicola]NID12693.1 DegT/DnrJ/EryC1/StrS family aminotransferase [Fibrivirga algicola]
MINVTKSYLPDLAEYTRLLEGVWERVHLTNNGPLLRQLEANMRAYLGIRNLQYCTNGTVVLQLALKALGITKEVITTPFSYCATTNVLLWEGCTPVFADIRADDFCIDADLIEPLITENTQAILATHVYGNACRIEQIEALATKYNLKVIYDGAHAFGAEYNGRAVLDYGDVSTCSFHATKVFHTVEGGCLITSDDELAKKMQHFGTFGHHGDEYYSMGINAKSSEFHAAMGLCVLPKVDELIAARKTISEQYNSLLDFTRISRPILSPGMTRYNYAYYPIVLASEQVLLNVVETLTAEGIVPRRYFYPSLNTLPFVENAQSCPVSEDIALRVLSLPLYPSLAETDVARICQLVNEAIVAEVV